ncbi:MAG: 5'/3'-nucleotidase SurE [Cyclobacteriaceae bacterium]
MNFLLVNDDGIYSPGILALAEVASEFGRVIILAPNMEQSSMSHAITSTRPLSYISTPVKDFEAYRVNGTPADCVALGTYLWPDTDMVLSGINLGLNIGTALWHSGTLAAAKQAVLLGYRGIALSTDTRLKEYSLEDQKPFVKKALEIAFEQEMDLININFPQKPEGFMWTRQSIRHYDGKMVPGEDPRGKKHYWFTVVPIEATEEGTDRWAIEHNQCSLTPLRLDLTSHNELSNIREKEIEYR